METSKRDIEFQVNLLVGKRKKLEADQLEALLRESEGKLEALRLLGTGEQSSYLVRLAITKGPSENCRLRGGPYYTHAHGYGFSPFPVSNIFLTPILIKK